MTTDGGAETNAVVAELIAIKTLLVLALTEGREEKVSQLKVARALGVGQASISRMVSPPKRYRAHSRRNTSSSGAARRR